MALDVAKELYDPNPNYSSMRSRTIYGLSTEGLITDPQIIPYLIKALKTTRGRNTSGIRKNMADALSFMTARMMGMVCTSAPEYSLEPDTKEEADRLYNFLSQGGADCVPPHDEFWGYWGTCQDRFGIRWMFNISAQQ